MEIQFTLNFEYLTEEQRQAFAVLVGWAPPSVEDKQEKASVEEWATNFQTEWQRALNDVGIDDIRIERVILRWVWSVLSNSRNPSQWQGLYENVTRHLGHLPNLHEFLHDEKLWNIRLVGEKTRKTLREIRDRLTTG